jgi:hypothetical protein
MLLVTVGDHAMDQLAGAGLATPPALVPLVWRDILHEGPVPAGLDLAALSRLRAGWIAAASGLPEARTAAGFAARDQALATAAGAGAVLAFDHNLVNQLQLAQLLDWFAVRPDAGPLSLVLLPSFAAAGPAELAAAFAARAPVGPELLEVGAAAWAAFRAPDPTALEAVLPACAALLPPMAAALRRHLEQFPAAGDGLARSERQALATMAAAPGRQATLTELMHAQSEAEPLPFLGDTWLMTHLARLGGGQAPLVSAAGQGGPWMLTTAGAEVLAGRADRAELVAIDHWLGGVHLRGRPAWRWDRDGGRLVAT